MNIDYKDPKRLTERDEFGNADIIGVDTADLQFNLDFEQMNLVTDALNKLADYEESNMASEVERLRAENAGLKQYASCEHKSRCGTSSPYNLPAACKTCYAAVGLEG